MLIDSMEVVKNMHILYIVHGFPPRENAGTEQHCKDALQQQTNAVVVVLKRLKENQEVLESRWEELLYRSGDGLGVKGEVAGGREGRGVAVGSEMLARAGH